MKAYKQLKEPRSIGKFVSDEEDFDEDRPKGQLGYYIRPTQSHTFTVYLNEAIQAPEYYTSISNMLANAEENDVVWFKINSPGGRYSGMLSILDAIALCRAPVFAHIQGECHSAASIIALHCDDILVGPYATMLCHNARYGIGGKSADIVSSALHQHAVARDLLHETYAGFFSEEEIEEICEGREVYLDADQIVERLEKKRKYDEANKSEDEGRESPEAS